MITGKYESGITPVYR